MSTNSYVIDAWAWIEFLRGSKAGLIVKKRIENSEVFTSIITISEVISKFAREGLNADEAFQAIISLSKVINSNEVFVKEVGFLHAEIKKREPTFSLADAFVLQTAKKMHARILTGDSGFIGVKEADLLISEND